MDWAPQRREDNVIGNEAFPDCCGISILTGVGYAQTIAEFRRSLKAAFEDVQTTYALLTLARSSDYAVYTFWNDAQAHLVAQGWTLHKRFNNSNTDNTVYLYGKRF